MNWLRRLWPAYRREPCHVRLHLVHEASDTGDVTIEGFQTHESRDWIVLERAVIVKDGGSRRTRVAGAIDIPRSRLIMREHLVAVALPELPELVGA